MACICCYSGQAFSITCFILVKLIKCDTLLAIVLIVLYAMSTGGATAIFAQEYVADSHFAAEAVFLTDIFCLVTLPVIVVML